MAQTVELPISGQATSTVMVNLRQGAPSVQAPVLRKLDAGVTIPVQAVVVGDSVQGNPHWYKTADGYAWAGAFGPLNTVGAAAASGSTPGPVLTRNTAAAVVNQPYCIDLYEGDNVIDSPGPLGGFTQVKAQGIPFLDHKASQGASKQDSRVAARYSAWMNGGTISVTDVDGTKWNLAPRFGFYHFNGTGNASDEAKNFIATVTPIFNKGDDLCLDWEDIGSFQQPASWVDDFCKAVEDWCQFSIKIYGGDAPRAQLTISLPSTILDNFASRRLWFCEYGPFNSKLVPLPWQSSGPLQWQDNGDENGVPKGPGPNTIPGISNLCDNSTVVGTMTVAKLNAMWGGGQSVA